MSKGSIFDKGWIDLVFEGRNQKYGAYQLRRQASKTTLTALVSGIALIGVLVGIPAIVNHLKHDDSVVEVLRKDTGIVIHEVEFPTPPEPPKPEPETQAPPAAPADPQPTIEFKPLAPTSDPVETPAPTTGQVQTTNAGPTTTPGTGGDDFKINTPTGTGAPGSQGTAPTSTGDDGPLSPAMLDKVPEFPGGMKKFYDYVGNNFKSPESSSDNIIRVYVSFVIEKDGSMTNIKVPRDPGYGMANEAIRVLKSLKTKWKPGIKNGQPVRTAYNLPIAVQPK